MKTHSVQLLILSYLEERRMMEGQQHKGIEMSWIFCDTRFTFTFFVQVLVEFIALKFKILWF